MPERIFERQAEGPSKIISDQGELKNLEARRRIIELLETDPETQKDFRESGKTKEEFIDHHIKYFGKDAVKNIFEVGYNTIMQGKKKYNK